MRPPPPPRRLSRPACAACKHQRRRCTAACQLAPYFPADQPERFANAQRLFGIRNIVRTIRDAGPVHRDDAAKALLFEANARAAHRAHGAMGVLRSLHAQLDRAHHELAALRQQLAICRRHQHAAAAANAAPPWMQQPPQPAEAQYDGVAYVLPYDTAPYGVVPKVADEEQEDRDADAAALEAASATHTAATSMEREGEGSTSFGAGGGGAPSSSSSYHDPEASRPRRGHRNGTSGLHW